MTDPAAETVRLEGDGGEHENSGKGNVKKVDEVEREWLTQKATTIDLTEAEKTAFEAARDSVKQLLALATGIIALTITFEKDYVASAEVGRWIALTAWGLFMASAFLGLWALNALTGNAGAVKPKAWLSTRSFNVALPSTLQVLAFVAGLICTFGYAAKATGKTARMQIEDEANRRQAVRVVAEEDLFWAVRTEITESNGQLDSTGIAFLRRIVTAGATRIDYRSPHDSSAAVQRNAERLAAEVLRTSQVSTGVQGAPSVIAVRASGLSRAMFGLCPLYPFC